MHAFYTIKLKDILQKSSEQFIKNFPSSDKLIQKMKQILFQNQEIAKPT